MDPRERLYRSYLDFHPLADEDRSNEVFAIELQRAGLSPPARILEIGFGRGHFLDWARKNGYEVSGVEIIEEFVRNARDRGHDVFTGIAQDVIDPGNQYDLIAAFDVFEHLSISELVDLLRFAKRILSKDGVILARFPNGSSPFGAHYQNGDATHNTALSGTRIGQIALVAGMRLVFAGNSARSLRAGRRHWALKRVAYIARDTIEWAIGQVYFGERIPLDPNLTVIIGNN